MTPSPVCFHFPALPSQLAQYSAEVEQALPEHLRGDAARVGLSEAIANAILHGALGIRSHARDEGNIDAFLDEIVRVEEAIGASRSVTVEVTAVGDDAEIVVTDPGEGFDWRTPHCGAGCGLQVMRDVFSEVSWNEAGNQVRMLLRARR